MSATRPNRPLPEAPAEHVRPALDYVPIQLPSRGRFYGPKSVIPTPELPNGEVQIRKMRVAEEEKLHTAGGNMLTKLGKLISAVTKLPEKFDPNSLLVVDRFYLLLALRTLCFGSNYTIQFKCSTCGASNKHVVDITKDLTEKTADENSVEPVPIDLPDAGVTITMRYRRGIDEVEELRVARQAEARGEDGTPLQEQLRRRIVEIDGETEINPLKKMDFIRSLTATDSLKIRSVLNEVEPGVDLTIHPECTRCNASNELEVPFTNEFFRPTSL